MLRPLSFVCGLTVALLVSSAAAQEYKVETIDGLPDAEEISKELLEKLSDKGFRVVRGSSRTAAEIWLLKELPIDGAFEASEERLYPFTLGQLLGVLHYRRRGSDFRDQQVNSGWYTLRFGLQPIDGNHEGTSPTRDFLLLVDAEQDEFPEVWDGEEALHETSAEAAGSTHPAMLCLQRPTDGNETAMRHDEGNDWWILHVIGKGVAGDKSKDVPIDIVVAGHAAE